MRPMNLLPRAAGPGKSAGRAARGGSERRRRERQDEQAIRATAKAYQEALAKGDPKALAQFWTTDGDYIDPLGEAHPASELIAEADGAAGQGPQPKAKVTQSKIRFVTADVAIEEGASEVESPDAAGAPAVRGHFHAVWVKQAGRWRLASLCEIPGDPKADASLAEANLADLAWMVGDWTGESDGVKLEVSVQKNPTATFLLREITALVDGKAVLRGSQRIGQDPLTGKLKSWGFDSNGGHDEATWTKDGDSWVGQATGVLPDGRRTSATIVITYDGHDSYTRKVLASRVGGEPAPDQLVRFTRQAAPEQ